MRSVEFRAHELLCTYLSHMSQTAKVLVYILAEGSFSLFKWGSFRVCIWKTWGLCTNEANLIFSNKNKAVVAFLCITCVVKLVKSSCDWTEKKYGFKKQKNSFLAFIVPTFVKVSSSLTGCDEKAYMQQMTPRDVIARTPITRTHSTLSCHPLSSRDASRAIQRTDLIHLTLDERLWEGIILQRGVKEGWKCEMIVQNSL